MLLVEFFGSGAFFEQLRCAAGWNTFQNQKIPPQQPTQPRLVYSALVGRQCGRIPRTQPALKTRALKAKILKVYILASTDYSCASRYIENIPRCIDYVCALTRRECLLYACCDW